MKKTILVTSLMLLLTATPAMSQMMGGQGGQQMMEQQQMQQTAPTGGQYYNQYMNPGMMGAYGYNMGSQMMGGYGYGYGMNPGMMMGGYGYGMGPSMMGTGQHPCITGGYGYGMGHHEMMHGYSGYPGMMGYYSPEQYEKQYKEQQEFLNETKELRKKLHMLKFDFAEAQRDPDTKREELEKLNTEMENTWKQIYEKKFPTAK